MRPVVQDTYIAVRNGRYVIPAQAQLQSVFSGHCPRLLPFPENLLRGACRGHGGQQHDQRAGEGGKGRGKEGAPRFDPMGPPVCAGNKGDPLAHRRPRSASQSRPFRLRLQLRQAPDRDGRVDRDKGGRQSFHPDLQRGKGRAHRYRYRRREAGDHHQRAERGREDRGVEDNGSPLAHGVRRACSSRPNPPRGSLFSPAFMR